jgi:virginiamycin B lyase
MSAITTGSDGNLWLGVQTLTGGNVVRVTPLGQITEFPLPDVAGNVLDITAGPDGALWFTEESANQIGRITTSGVLTEYALAPGSGPVGITVGRDRAIWFTELSGFVGRISGGPLAASSIPMLGSTMLFCLGAALAASAMLLIRRF